MNNFKTQATKAQEVKRDWHLIDAKGEILGRMGRARKIKQSPKR